MATKEANQTEVVDQNTSNNGINDKKNDKDDEDDWKVQRDQEKQYGNNAFKAKDYATAIHHYSAALSLDPNNHILLSNRSAAYLSSNQKSKALHDAQSCVQHSPPDYIKGYSRLGAALQSLGRAQPALDAWEKVLKVDPTNAAAVKGKEDSQRILEAQKQLKKEEEEPASKAEDPQEDNNGDDDDDLDDFFNDVEEATTEVQKAKQDEAEALDKPKATNAIKSHKKDLGTSSSQIDRLLQTNYEWRNLNPFFVLDVPPTATLEEISRRYKALSLLLHPDKNRSQHDKAEEAYDQVQKAKTMLLDDEHKAKHCRDLAAEGMRQGKRDWEQLSKADKKRQQNSLEDMQNRAILRIFAQVEHKRREVEKRQRAQEQRERAQEEEEMQKERNAMKFEKNWREQGRQEKRVGNWRDFQQKKKGKTE